MLNGVRINVLNWVKDGVGLSVRFAHRANGNDGDTDSRVDSIVEPDVARWSEDAGLLSLLSDDPHFSTCMLFSPR